MACSLPKFITILSLTLSLLLAFHLQISFSQIVDDFEEDEELYVLDDPTSHPNFRSGSRFLASIVKKGTTCNTTKKNKKICNGVSANKGASLLLCCKTHCRNVLSDKNNCGKCGKKCKLGQKCCKGSCVNVAYNPKHCGKCDRKCSKGVRCEAGFCGYA